MEDAPRQKRPPPLSPSEPASSSSARRRYFLQSFLPAAPSTGRPAPWPGPAPWPRATLWPCSLALMSCLAKQMCLAWQMWEGQDSSVVARGQGGRSHNSPDRPPTAFPACTPVRSCHRGGGGWTLHCTDCSALTCSALHCTALHCTALPLTTVQALPHPYPAHCTLAPA